MPVFVAVNHDNLGRDRSLAYVTKKAAVFFSCQKRSLQSRLLLAINQRSTSLLSGKVPFTRFIVLVESCPSGHACHLKD